MQCTPADTTACTGATPACGSDHHCRACQAHGDCALSNACLPDGSCAAADDVAFVDSAGIANAACTRPAPCGTIAAALATGRHYLRLHGSFDEAVTVDRGRVVTWFADPGTTLTRSTIGSASVVTVKDDATSLAITDLAILNTRDTGTIGIQVPSGAPSLSLTRVTISKISGGAIAIAGGSLTLAQSVIGNNLGGGVTVTGTARFAILGNVFLDNGTGSAPAGALGIATTPSPDNRLEFNSFYKNAAQDGVGAAIQCVAGPFTARNNIMFANGTSTNLQQVGGTCTHEYSIARPGTAVAGSGNQPVDPLFRDPANGDLHVLPESPAYHGADPRSDLSGLAARDRDGALRVTPATIGAYQMP